MKPCLFAAFLPARGLWPTRPPRRLMRPRCGRMEGGRRLAGPGLGGVAAKRTLAQAVGRPPLRRADPLLTAVGGSWQWLVMRRTPRGTPDKPPHPHLLTPLFIGLTIIGRREEPSVGVVSLL